MYFPSSHCHLALPAPLSITRSRSLARSLATMAAAAATASAALSSAALGTPFAGRVSLRPNLQPRRALFAVPGARGGRMRAMAMFNVKLLTPDGEVSFECPDDVYVLDQAEEAGIDLPYSCRAGACSSCTGMIVSGRVDQEDASFLGEEQKSAGFVLTCVAYPKSDLVIETHKEDAL